MLTVYLSYDEAIERARTAFNRAHPRQALPDWFDDVVAQHSRLTAEGMVELRYFIRPAEDLAEDVYWAATAQGLTIMAFEPEFGLVPVVGRTPPEPIFLYRVVIDPVTGNVLAEEDLDMAAVLREDLEPPSAIFEFPIYSSVIARWTHIPDKEQAERVRDILPSLRSLMPSRIIINAKAGLPIDLGNMGYWDADRLQLALAPLGLIVERR